MLNDMLAQDERQTSYQLEAKSYGMAALRQGATADTRTSARMVLALRQSEVRMAGHLMRGFALLAVVLLIGACSGGFDVSDGIGAPEECVAVGRVLNSRLAAEPIVGHFSPNLGSHNSAYWDPRGNRCLITGLPSTHSDHPVLSNDPCREHGGYYNSLPASGTDPEFCFFE